MAEASGIDAEELYQIVLPVLLGALCGAVGYWFRGWQDRKNLPKIEADSETFKQNQKARRELLSKLDYLFFDLDHWLREKIPNYEKIEDRKNYIMLSREYTKNKGER